MNMVRVVDVSYGRGGGSLRYSRGGSRSSVWIYIKQARQNKNKKGRVYLV